MANHPDLLLLFQRAQAQITDRVDAVRPGGWDVEALPGWSVADLVAHLTAEQLRVAPLLAGGAPDDVRGRIPTRTEDLLGDDPLGSWEAAADEALAAWADPDVLTRTVRLTSGPVPASDHLVASITDLVVHAWDLAQATGGVTALDADLVDAALVDAERRLGADGVPGLVAPPVTVDGSADRQTRLLARYGRRS